MGYFLSEVQSNRLRKSCEVKFTAMHTNYRQQKFSKAKIKQVALGPTVIMWYI